MRIAFQSVFYPYRGGIAQFNASLFRALESVAEIEAFNFSLQYPNIFFPGSSQFVSPDDRADPISSKRLLNSINPISYISTANAIKKYNPDLLITAYWQPFLAPAQGTVCKLIKNSVTNISVINNISPHEKKWSDKWLNLYFLKQQHAHMVMGKAIQNELLEYVPNTLNTLHPHPIYAHFGEKKDQSIARKNLMLHPNKKTILFFGLIREYKGLEELIKAFNLLDDSYQLVIAGESYEDFNRYQVIVNESSKSEGIHLHLRYIPDHEVPNFFSAADLCVLPYKNATQSGVVAISFHFDLPVIVTNKGNLKDTIEPYNTGLVVENPAPKPIAEAIKYFFNKNHAYEMVKNINSFKEKYTWKHFAEETLKLYEKVQRNKKHQVKV